MKGRGRYVSEREPIKVVSLELCVWDLLFCFCYLNSECICASSVVTCLGDGTTSTEVGPFFSKFGFLLWFTISITCSTTKRCISFLVIAAYQFFFWFQKMKMYQLWVLTYGKL